MSRLSTLIENRGKVKDKLEARVAELDAILVDRVWTEDEERSLSDLKEQYGRLDTLVTDAETEETEARSQQEQRDAKLGGAGGVEGAPAHVNGTGPLTYGEANPQNSFYRDLLSASLPANTGHMGAMERLRSHQAEMDAIRERATPHSKEGRAVAAYDREVRRLSTDERRAVSTGSGSMGDFAPPLYFLEDYAAYRTYGRTLIDQMKKYPMPETGMTFNVPKITVPTQANNQTAGSGENSTVTSRDMTSTYESGTVQTIVDNLTVSQQYLDRVGPGIGGDMIVRDDQQRQYNRSLNLYAWGALMTTPGIGTINFPLPGGDSSFNAAVAAFKHAVHGAKAIIRNTDGIVAYPTHFITDGSMWEQIEGSYDTNNRPLVVPQGVAFNPLAVGDESNAPEGYTGFKFASMPAFSDESMWVQWNQNGSASAGFSTDHVALVAALDIFAYWLEGPPVIRVLPQPFAAQLSVLIQQFGYCAFVPVYPAASQLIFGAGTADSLVSAF